MKPGRVFIFSAPSGGGKTSLTRALVPRLAERGMRAEISVSYTTRAPRPGEQEGVHYHFVDMPVFNGMIERGEFLEHAEVYGRRYGTGRARTEALLAAGADVFLDIDWQGAQQVKRLMPAVGVFILPPSREILEQRLRGRGQDSAAVIAARMEEAHAEMQHHAEYDYLVVNEIFDQALADIEGIVTDERLLIRSARTLGLQRKAQQERLAPLLASLLAA